MVKGAKLLRNVLRVGVAGAFALALAGCTAIYRNHGYAPTQAELDEIVVGVDTRDSVTESVGAPSSSGVLKDSGYYYVATKMRHYGAKEPEVVERRLVAISFDNAGVVRGVEEYSLEDGRVVPLTRRVTDTGITDKTFVRQLLGNIGRFNPEQFIN